MACDRFRVRRSTTTARMVARQSRSPSYRSPVLSTGHVRALTRIPRAVSSWPTTTDPTDEAGAWASSTKFGQDTLGIASPATSANIQLRFTASDASKPHANAPTAAPSTRTGPQPKQFLQLRPCIQNLNNHHENPSYPTTNCWNAKGTAARSGYRLPPIHAAVPNGYRCRRRQMHCESS